MGLLERLRESVYTQGTNLLLSLFVFWGEVSNISLVSSPSSNWLPHGESEGGRALPAFCWTKHHLEDGVVSPDTPSAFVQSICVLLEIETCWSSWNLLVLWHFTYVSFSKNFICLLVSLSGDLCGDYLLALALQFRIKRNTHDPTQMVVHRSHFCISSSCPSLFQWWLLVLPLWLWLSLRLCGRTWLLRTSTFPVNTLSQFSHAIFSSLGTPQSRVLGRRMFLCTASFQLRWRVKLIPKGRIYWLSSCEFLYKLLWRLGRERPLLLFPLFCSTVCLAVWSSPSLHPYSACEALACI